MARWGLIFWRYYRMMKRIKHDPAAMSYSDEAMRLRSASDETDKIVESFADIQLLAGALVSEQH